MYHDELNREARLITQGWQLLVNDLSRLLAGLRMALGPTHGQAPATFHMHRAPDADRLG